MVNCKYNSLRSFSSDRSYTLNRSSYARDSMMIEELLVPSKEQVCILLKILLDCWTFIVVIESSSLFHDKICISACLILHLYKPSCTARERGKQSIVKKNKKKEGGISCAIPRNSLVFCRWIPKSPQRGAQKVLRMTPDIFLITRSNLFQFFWRVDNNW